MWSYVLEFIQKWPVYSDIEMSFMLFTCTIAFMTALLIDTCIKFNRPRMESEPPVFENADLVLNADSWIVKLQLFLWHTYARDICQYVKRCGTLLFMAFLLFIFFGFIFFIGLPALLYQIYSNLQYTLEISGYIALTLAGIAVLYFVLCGAWKILKYSFAALSSSKPLAVSKVAIRSIKEKTCIRIGYH